MKALTTLIAAAACFALIVSVANASFDRSLPAKAPHAKVLKKTAKKGGTKGGTKTGKIGGSTKVVVKPSKPLQPIIIVGPPLPATQIVSSDDCANTGNNCTDEQLCDLWGESCDQLDVPSTPAAPADNAAAPADNQDPGNQDG